ncbi:MAG: recombinase family protein, partial [Fusobacteriaceae bacterium]
MVKKNIKKSDEPINVVCYIRFSSDNQKEESVDAQLRAISAYCKGNNYIIREKYIDRAQSGTTDKRPEFQRMISDAEKGEFKYVIVHKLDRFSRNRYDSIIYKKKLQSLGIRVISVLENFDDSPESVILESMMEGFAEYYSKNLAREVKKGLAENAYQCKHTGGLAPLGYNVDPITKKYNINVGEAECVKLIYKLYLDDWTSGNIFKKLNELGYKTKKKSDWTKNSLQSILRNEKYTGTYIYNKVAAKDMRGKRNNHNYKNDEEIIRIENGLPVIIPKEEFERVKEKMAGRKLDPSQTVSKQTYLLSGLVKCECGHAMSGNVRRAKRKNKSGTVNKPEYVSYRCGCRKTKSTIVCDNSEIRKEYLEEYVMS